MPGSHIALLRGINVGRAKRIPMEDLRDLFQELGFGDIRTLLNSGNVVFTASKKTATQMERQLEEAVAARFGFSSRVTVVTARELTEIVEGNPLADVALEPSRFLVTFLKRPEDRSNLMPLLEQDWTPEALGLGTRAAYLWCADGILASRVGSEVGRVLGENATSRNWATVTKLHSFLRQSG